MLCYRYILMTPGDEINCNRSLEIVTPHRTSGEAVVVAETLESGHTIDLRVW